MYAETVFRLIILSITIILGFLAYRRNSRHATNTLLALLTVLIFLWGVSNEISLYSTTTTGTLFWIRMTMFFAVPTAVLFFVFMHTFPRASLAMSRQLMALVLLVTGSVMSLSLSPWLFTTIADGVGANAKPVPGFGIIIFALTVTAANLTAIYLLIVKNFKLSGVFKLQARYLLLGTAITLSLIMGLVFFPVVLLRFTAFVPYQSELMLPFVALTAYAIVRYRLMDIRAAIARSLSFSILLGAFFAIYGAILIFAVPRLADWLGIREGFIAAVGALLSVLLARYIQEALRRLTDRFLFQNQIDYRRALVETSKELSTTIHIEDVTRTVLDIMEKVIRTKKTIIFLQENKGHNFTPYANRGASSIKVSIPKEHVLVRHIQHNMGLLVKDELAHEREQERDESHAAEIKQVEQTFVWLDMAVVLPLYVNKQLTGLIVLGDKKSGTPYMQDDLNFLAALSPQAATALENARLYQESLAFGEKLKSEVKRATHELEIANAQLRDLDKAKSEFLSIASHQLYTPMTALRGYLSMLREGDYGATPSKQQPIIKILETSSTRLINLIKNLLDVSRIESGRLELNLESLDFSHMVKELVQDLMPNALNKKVKLQYYQPAEQLPHVVADQERVRQVILNIVDNAIKYTDQGRIDVRVQQTDHTITLTVNDTGRGMTPDEMTKLFTKFTRVGGASKYRKEGTGLGLYVAKQIIREHHGDIEITSPGLNHGSTFYVHLPIEGSPNALTAGKKVSVEIKAGK